MPVYNVTVDDSSPMIVYSEGWNDSNSSDLQLSSYFKNTSHVTSIPNASASFSFFGNAVYLFGAMREGYGPFTVSLDGQDTPGTSAPSGNAVFRQLLFSRAEISNDEHILVLKNNGTGTSVDVDYIVFTTGNGNSTTQPVDSTLDDTAPQINYRPEDSVWVTTNSVRSFYHNNSFHESQDEGAQIVVPFTGDAVSVFGSTSPQHGTFSVQIDNRHPINMNGSAPQFRAQTLLYWAGGIGSGQHQLEITNTQDQFYLDFDFLVATSWNPSTPSSTSTHHPKSKTPIIAGVISGSCVVIAWIVALIFLLRRRRKRRREIFRTDLAEADPEPFILPADPAVVDGSHRPGQYAFGNRRSGKFPIPHHHSHANSTSTPSVPIASTSSSPRTHTQTRGQENRGHASNSSLAISGMETSQLLAPSPAMASSQVLMSSMAMAAQPSASSQAASSNDSSAIHSDTRPGMSLGELSAFRMTVPNRPQDWGPIIPLPNDEHEEGLPPDYQQAIQPMPGTTVAEHVPGRPYT